uniref:SFRICE_005342 n=1 Tax=Spodoptera frugiperda TaxID=7108 RepID=A0A2H1VH10_SPOFR
MANNSGNKHLGHLFFEHMKTRPNAVCQIDAATGKYESNASVLYRSMRLAQCLRQFGAKPGDVLALHGKNHLDIHIPYYAALLNGMPIVGVDPMFKFEEIKKLFKLTKPKVAFCQCEHFIDAVTELGLDTKVVTFSEGKHSIQNFIREYDDEDDLESFRPAEFDLDKIYLWLISTGGTSGVLKIAAFKHRPWMTRLKELRKYIQIEDSPRNTPALFLSPVQWIGGFYNAIAMPLFNLCKIQTSLQPTTDHIVDIIKEYRPISALFGPSMLDSLLKHEKICDFTSFNLVMVTGGKVHKELLHELRKRIRPDAIAAEMYGQTETMGQVFSLEPDGPLGSCGKATDVHQVKLMDPDTDIEITKPKVTGELWLKGPMFTEYYNDPRETAAVFTEDGWFKTGDLLYKDKNDYFYFVERLGMLIKYRNYHVAPLEIVEVIRQHPGVKDVSVTSISNVFDGEHPVACVVRRPGYKVTAHEIKELVADKLSYSKRLRGGVIFMEKIPRTSAGKVARAKLKHIAAVAYRE